MSSTLFVVYILLEDIPVFVLPLFGHDSVVALLYLLSLYIYDIKQHWAISIGRFFSTALWAKSTSSRTSVGPRWWDELETRPPAGISYNCVCGTCTSRAFEYSHALDMHAGSPRRLAIFLFCEHTRPKAIRSWSGGFDWIRSERWR